MGPAYAWGNAGQPNLGVGPCEEIDAYVTLLDFVKVRIFGSTLIQTQTQTQTHTHTGTDTDTDTHRH